MPTGVNLHRSGPAPSPSGSPDQLAHGWAGHDCRLVTTVQTPHDLPSNERGTPIQIYSPQQQPWPQLWPHLTHDD